MQLSIFVNHAKAGCELKNSAVLVDSFYIISNDFK